MKRMGCATIAATLVALAGCSGGSEKSEPKTFDAAGTITLRTTRMLSAEGTCIGTDGYEDMRGGATVVVYDASDKKVGLGNLEDGTTSTGSDCTFAFKVEDIPVDGDIYSVEVSTRGKMSFKRADAGDIALTLG